MSIFLLVLGLVLFVALVVVHEWGHFVAARRNGIEVEEFGIGFPPRAMVFAKKNGTVYTLNWLPLGGFVKLKGEHDADTAKGSFGAATLGAKVKVMTAGVLMNLITAFVLLTILALIGIPILVDKQFTVARDAHVAQVPKNEGVVTIDSVIKGGPADKAALHTGDRIISVAGSTITDPGQVGAIAKAHAGQRIPVVVQRQGKGVSTVLVQTNSEQVVKQQKQGYVGVTPASQQEGIRIERYTWSAPVVAVGLIKQFTELTFGGLGSAIGSLFVGDTQKATEQVAGPVGIFVLLKEGSLLGVRFILMIIAIISLTLAIMNVLPIPALDGGRLFVTLLFRAIRQPLTEKKEELIHGTGFALLMVLFVLITIVDVKRFF